MGEGRHETHNHHQRCDRRRWPRRLWVDSHADCAANRHPDSSADDRPDCYTYSGAIARPDTYT